MGHLRFRRTIKIAPGVRLNIGKTGVSTSVGVRGANVTFGRRGTTSTVGIPGTGLSYSSTKPPTVQGRTGWPFRPLILAILAVLVLLALSAVFRLGMP